MAQRSDSKMLDKKEVLQRLTDNGYNIKDVIDAVAGEAPYSIRGGGIIRRSCPLPSHPDSSASFDIDTTKNTCHCFGCMSSKDHPDVFGIVQRIKGISFKEAVVLVNDTFNLDASSYKASVSSDPLSNAKTSLKALAAAMTETQEKYDNNLISADDFDSQLSAYMKPYQYALEEVYNYEKMPSSVSYGLKRMFLDRIPMWLTIDGKLSGTEENFDGVIGMKKDIPLYTSDGTKLCDSFERIVLSADSKVPIGAFVEFTPAKGLDKKFKIKSKDEVNGRWHINDNSGCMMIYSDKKEGVFEAYKCYVDVNNVFDSITLNRLNRERFNEKNMTPEYLVGKTWCEPDKRLVFLDKNQNVWSFKVYGEGSDSVLRTQHAPIDAFKGIDPYSDRVTVDDIFEKKGNTSDFSISDADTFKKRCEWASSVASQNPSFVTRDKDIGNKIQVNIASLNKANSIGEGRGT